MLGFSLSWLFSKHVAKNCTIFLSSWEGLGARGEGDDRGWDGWIASPTRWTWVWVNSGSWWWTGRPGVLRFMGSQRVDTTEQLNGTELNWMALLAIIDVTFFSNFKKNVENKEWNMTEQLKKKTLLRCIYNR